MRLPAVLAPTGTTFTRDGLMADGQPSTRPAVVGLPAEVDISNAGAVAAKLRAAITPDVGVVVADLTTTAFCDSSGMRIRVLARDWATDDGVELRLVVPPGPTLVVLKLIGLDQLLPVYPDLGQALKPRPVGGHASPAELAPSEAPQP
jgi:anti-anti-sigma factor